MQKPKLHRERRPLKPTVVTSGIVVVDKLSNSGVRVSSFSVGGACGNVSANVASLGLKVVPVAVVGDDLEGRFALNDLRRCGVDVSFVQQRKNMRTPVMLHEVFGGRKNNGGVDHAFRLIVGARSSPARYSSPDARLVEAFTASRLSADLFFFDQTSPEILPLIAWAKSVGAITFYEPSSLRHAEQVRMIAQHADILKLSEDLLRTSARSSTLDAAVKIVTKGAAGLVVTFSSPRRSPIEFKLCAIPVPNLVDSAGAGDALSAGLIFWMLAKLDLHKNSKSRRELIVDSLTRAQRLASINCSFKGARGAFRATCSPIR